LPSLRASTSPFPREQIGHLPHVNPNIARTAVKVGESSATNRAGTDVTIFSIVSLNQSSIGFPP
jgi:hypothetical protein